MSCTNEGKYDRFELNQKIFKEQCSEISRNSICRAEHYESKMEQISKKKMQFLCTAKMMVSSKSTYHITKSTNSVSRTELISSPFSGKLINRFCWLQFIWNKDYGGLDWEREREVWGVSERVFQAHGLKWCRFYVNPSIPSYWENFEFKICFFHNSKNWVWKAWDTCIAVHELKVWRRFKT